MNDDIYLMIGQLLEKIQKWENEFKLFTIKHNIKESDDKRSLSNMNSFLLRNNIISNEEYLLIKKTIEYRNFIIHKVFIEEDFDSINKINEMNSVINNSLEIFNK